MLDTTVEVRVDVTVVATVSVLGEPVIVTILVAVAIATLETVVVLCTVRVVFIVDVCNKVIVVLAAETIQEQA